MLSSAAPTFATLFSGGEIGGVGIRAAGYRHLWGIEYDNDIADVARLNGFETITADVLTVDPRTLPVPDYLHASPVCTRASNANTSAELNSDGTKEAPLDITMGEKTAQFIDVMRPRVITLENVYGYRNFAAFRRITDALSRNGYMWDYANLNAADFGVPQTRRRLILRAVRDALLPMFPAPVPWVGWYAAIEDLIPDLPESRFADWHLARLPAELVNSIMVGGATPAYSVAAAAGTGRHKAFIVDGENSRTDGSVTIRSEEYPIQSLTSSAKSLHRAWLSSGRVVSMTPRALARFQSIPDSYVLPDKKQLACKVIGNGYPSLMAQRIAEGFNNAE